MALRWTRPRKFKAVLGKQAFKPLSPSFWIPVAYVGDPHVSSWLLALFSPALPVADICQSEPVNGRSRSFCLSNNEKQTNKICTHTYIRIDEHLQDSYMLSEVSSEKNSESMWIIQNKMKIQVLGSPQCVRKSALHYNMHFKECLICTVTGKMGSKQQPPNSFCPKWAQHAYVQASRKTQLS